jgi:hypothetical protein
MLLYVCRHTTIRAKFYGEAFTRKRLRKREAKSGTRLESRRPSNKPRGAGEMVAHNGKKKKDQSSKLKRAATDLFDASWCIVSTYGFGKCSGRSIRHGNMAGDN